MNPWLEAAEVAAVAAVTLAAGFALRRRPVRVEVVETVETETPFQAPAYVDSWGAFSAAEEDGE